MSADATDDTGVSRVDFYVGSQKVGSDSTGSGTNSREFSFNWDSTSDTDGSKTITARAYDAAGNEKVSESRTITVGNATDTTAPTVSLTAPQDGATVSGSSVTLSADASDNVAVTKVEFLVDGQVVGTDTSAPYSVSWDSTTMTDGSATIKARAYDAARNSETSRAVVVDNTYPQTTISSGPAEGSTTQQTSASFSFTSSERDSTFRCKLDGGSFSVCSSPKDYSGLQPGSHTFTVYAVGSGGETSDSDSTTATRTWTVQSPPQDTTQPTVSLTAPANDAVVMGANVTLSADASDNVGVTKVEFLIGNNVVGTDTSAPFSATWDSRNVSDGKHPVTARAFDAANNQKTSTVRQVVVDNSFPNTAITGGPEEGSTANDTSATFTFNSTDGNDFRCQLDSNTIQTCSSPKSYTSLSPGQHTFRVWAVGSAGETSDTDPTPATRTWTIQASQQDTTQPNVFLTAPDNDAVVSGSNVGISADASDNVGVSRVEFLVNGNVAGTDTSAPYAFDWDSESVPDGQHTVSARVFDAAGNQRTSVPREVVVDNFYPNSTITSGPSEGSFTRSTSASFSFDSTDADGSFRCRLDDRAAETCSSGKSYSWLSQGRHTFTVWAVGSAGEQADTEQAPSTRSWTVDGTAPSGSVKINGGAASTKSLSVRLTLSASDSSGSGVSQVRFSNDGRSWSSWQSYATSKSWKLKSGKSGTRTVYVQYTDRAGNISATARDTIKYRIS